MLKKRWLSLIAANCALVALGLVSVGQASAATMKEHEAETFLAVYGYPGESSTSPAEERPIGGGLGRNFGFGGNMLFGAGTNLTGTVALSIKISGVTLEAKETWIGGTLLSNHTGENNPLSFSVEFVDFQNATAVGIGAAPTFADTHDREWIGEFCSPGAAVGKCKVDPLAGKEANQGAQPGEVKVENVSFNAFINKKPNVIQGTIWGKWINSPEAGKPPCIELHLPAAFAPIEHQTLVGTQGEVLGEPIEEIKGKLCLITMNNYWEVGHTPLIEIANS